MSKVQLVETRRLKLQVFRTRLVCFVLFITCSHADRGWRSNHFLRWFSLSVGLSRLYLHHKGRSRPGWHAGPSHGMLVSWSSQMAKVSSAFSDQPKFINRLFGCDKRRTYMWSKRLKWRLSHFSAATQHVLMAVSGVFWTDQRIMPGSRWLPCSHHSAVATLT